MEIFFHALWPSLVVVLLSCFLCIWIHALDAALLLFVYSIVKCAFVTKLVQ